MSGGSCRLRSRQNTYLKLWKNVYFWLFWTFAIIMPKVLFPKCFIKNKNNPAWIESHMDLSTIPQFGDLSWVSWQSFHFPALSCFSAYARTTNHAPDSGKPRSHEHRCKCEVSVLKITKNESFVIKKQYSFSKFTGQKKRWPIFGD